MSANILTLLRRTMSGAENAYYATQDALSNVTRERANASVLRAKKHALEALQNLTEACEAQGWLRDSGSRNIREKKSLNRARVVVPPDHVIERLHRRALEAVEGPILEEVLFRLMLDAWGEGAHYAEETEHD